MRKIVAAIENLAKREAKNPTVARTVHTAWQAALGAAVAALSGTHGDIRAAVLVGVAAAAAAIKNAVFGAVSAPPAVDPTTTAAVPAPPAS